MEYILLKIKIVSFTAGARSQKNTKPYQNLLNPMTTGLVKLINIGLPHQYGISVAEVLSLLTKRP